MDRISHDFPLNLFYVRSYSWADLEVVLFWPGCFFFRSIVKFSLCRARSVGMLSRLQTAADLIRHIRVHSKNNARVRQRRRADFYEPAATGSFKSAAEIAFLEVAKRLAMHRERNLSFSLFSTFKTLAAFFRAGTIDRKSSIRSPDFFATFS